MKGFYGSPTEGSLGIVGNVVKSLFKQEPKTVKINTGDKQELKAEKYDGTSNVNDISGYEYIEKGDWIITGTDGRRYSVNYNDATTPAEAIRAFKIDAEQAGIRTSDIEGGEVLQHSIDITPELKAQVQGGQPLFMRSPEGKVLGFTHNGKIYLNGKHLNPNTPIHEAGHIWTNWAEINSTEVHDAGMRLVEGSIYYEKVKNNPFYKAEANKLPADQRERYFKHEALAMAIGDRGAQFVTEAKKKGFAEWLKNLWETIKNAVGFKNVTAAQLANMTFEEFTSRAVADILREPGAQQQQQQQAEPELTEEQEEKQDFSDSIAEYQMTTSEEIGKFLSGKTIQESFGDAPEGDQTYYVQKRIEMLADGKAMIGKAQGMWGTNIADYGKHLFSYIKSMSGDVGLNNKRVVLTATFLGEIKEEMERNPSRADELRPLYNGVTRFYQKLMNDLGKAVSAGALLRLYRDKYMGDIFQFQILEEEELSAQRQFRQAEEDKAITDAAIEEYKRITAAEKAAEEAEAAEKEMQNQKIKSKKAKMSPIEANKMAAAKLEEISKKSGGLKKAYDKVKAMIDKLNCK
jgi:hypothetical protein